MTLTLKMSGREYQRSPTGAPDGSLAGGAALARVQNTSGEFRITTEGERGSLFDTAFAFTDSHLDRFVTFTEGTPPALGGVSHGSELERHWTYRITARVGADELILEGFRSEFAGTGITYIIHAAADLTALSANFPEDLGEGTGTGADGDIRTNTGPVEWQAIHFPEASDDRLQLYPMIVSGRTSSTVLRISDPYDNIDQFPAGPVTSLQWHLRDRPAYTHEQLYKIMFMFMLQCGWTVHQHRGKNNGAGTGGNDAGSFVFCVQDMILFSDGQAQDTAMFMRYAAFHRSNSLAGPLAGTDGSGSYGIDWAMWSAWDRDFAPIDLVDGTPNIFSNPGNGVNALSSHDGTNVDNRWAANAESANTANNAEPALSPNSFAGNPVGTPFHFNTRWGSEFHNDSARRSLRPNALNTFEGGDIQEIRYFMVGDKDEINIYLEAPGIGFWEMTMGAMQVRADAQGNKFTTNARTQSALGTPRVHVGGPGIGNGIDPTGTTPPYQIGDRLQLVGQTVNSGIIPSAPTTGSAAHAGEFIESSTITGLPGLTPAIGFVNCIQGADHVDAELLTISDGTLTITFEYDDNASVGGGNVAVDITGAPTAATMATRLDTAIGTTALTVASTPVGSQVQVTNNANGGIGNIPMTNTVVNVGFTTEGMGGGGFAIDIAGLNNDQQAGSIVGEDPQPMFFFRPWSKTTPIGVAAASKGCFRVSNRSNNGDGTYFDWNGPEKTVILSNGFDCLAEVSGLHIADTSEVNPNARSGRFPLMTVNCKDTDGGQIRGSMKFHRLASPMLGAYQFKRDRNGDYHMILPFQGRHQSDFAIGPTSSNHFVSAFGPIPSAMAFVG